MMTPTAERILSMIANGMEENRIRANINSMTALEANRLDALTEDIRFYIQNRPERNPE